MTGIDQRTNEEVNMVSHHCKCVQFILSEFNPLVNGVDHKLTDRRLPKVRRTIADSIHLAVHPNESLPIGELSRTGRHRWRQNTMQAPCYEQVCAFRVDVRQSTRSHLPIECVRMVETLSQKATGVETSLDAARTSACATSLS